MKNNHLSRKADSVKSEASDVIDELIGEIEELESANDVLQDRVNDLESENEKLREEVEGLYEQAAGADL
jgi:chaperonin cofactor prefoldin